MELEIEQTAVGLRVSGEMTVYSASALKPVLLLELQIEREALELDLSYVREFDTAGLQLLLMLQRHAAATARKVRIVGCSHVVRAALDLCHQAHFVADSAGAGLSS
jgi:anti-sigma B factor antagonist